MYDHNARRIFPAIRHVATIDNLPDMEDAVDRREVAEGVWWTHLDSKFIMYIDRHTGDYWVGEGKVARLLEDRFYEAIRLQEEECRIDEVSRRQKEEKAPQRGMLLE